MLCPVCAAKQITNHLELYQINLEEAVYLCQDKNCTYPEDSNFIIAERNLQDIRRPADQPFLLTQTGGTNEHVSNNDVEQWLNDILEMPQENVVNKRNSGNQTFDFDEFEKLLVREEETSKLVPSGQLKETATEKDFQGTVRVKEIGAECLLAGEKHLCEQNTSLQKSVPLIQAEENNTSQIIKTINVEESIKKCTTNPATCKKQIEACGKDSVTAAGLRCSNRIREKSLKQMKDMSELIESTSTTSATENVAEVPTNVKATPYKLPPELLQNILAEQNRSEERTQNRSEGFYIDFNAHYRKIKFLKSLPHSK